MGYIRLLRKIQNPLHFLGLRPLLNTNGMFRIVLVRIRECVTLSTCRTYIFPSESRGERLYVLLELGR